MHYHRLLKLFNGILFAFSKRKAKHYNKSICSKFIICFVHVVMLVTMLSCSVNNSSLVCTLVIRDHKFEPDKIYAKANTKIELIVKNLDDTIEEFESESLRREKIIPANSTVKIKLPPLKPGVYKFFGEFHEETAQGELIVE